MPDLREDLGCYQLGGLMDKRSAGPSQPSRFSVLGLLESGFFSSPPYDLLRKASGFPPKPWRSREEALAKGEVDPAPRAFGCCSSV